MNCLIVFDQFHFVDLCKKQCLKVPSEEKQNETVSFTRNVVIVNYLKHMISKTKNKKKQKKSFQIGAFLTTYADSDVSLIDISDWALMLNE